MEVFKINYIYTVFLMMLINNILVYVLSRTPGFGKTERWIFRLLLAVCVCDLSDAFGMLLKYIAGPAILYVLDAVFLISIAFISFFFFITVKICMVRMCLKIGVLCFCYIYRLICWRYF